MLTTSVSGEDCQTVIGAGLSMEKSVQSTHMRCIMTARRRASYLRLARAVPPRDFERPGFEPIVGSASGHHDVGGFIEQCADHGVAAFRDPPDFDFARSVNPGRETEHGRHEPGFVETMSYIDAGTECERHHRPNARNPPWRSPAPLHRASPWSAGILVGGEERLRHGQDDLVVNGLADALGEQRVLSAASAMPKAFRVQRTVLIRSLLRRTIA
jgi:hypothetical protein